MTVKPFIALLLSATLAAFAWGCGDDSTAQSDGEGSLTKAQFVKQANGICSRGRSQMLASEDRGGPGMSEAEIVSLTIREAWLPELQQVIDQVRELGAPQGDGPEVEAFLDAMQEAVDTGAESQIPTLTRFGQIFAPAASLAREYDVSLCAF